MWIDSGPQRFCLRANRRGPKSIDVLMSPCGMAALDYVTTGEFAELLTVVSARGEQPGERSHFKG